jgi:hypothetical protein
MWQYLKRHEAFVRAALESGTIPGGAGARWEELRAFHREQLGFMQHERLIHLLVMLFVALFFLLAAGYSLLAPTWPGFALSALLLVLLAAYLVHYFRLENGVQRLYALANQLSERCGLVSSRNDQSSP